MDNPLANLASRMTRFFSGRGKSFVAPEYSELLGSDTSTLPPPSGRPYSKYLNTYADVNWVYICVKRIIQDVATVPIGLFDKSDKRIYKHPVLNILNNVNERMTYHDLMEWLQAGLELTGNSYWKLEGINGRGIPSSIWPIIPSQIEIVPSQNPREFIKGYIYHVNGQKIQFSAEEVLHFKTFNPSDYYYGLATLAAARTCVDTHLAGGKWNLSFLKNSARPDIAIVTPHALQPEQRARMRANWQQQYGGEDKSHGVAFLERGAKPELIGVSQKDMDFIQQTKMSREDICSTFGVPPALIGLFEYSNYANAEEQEKIYYRSTIIPKARKICQTLTEFFLPLFDPFGMMYFDVVESEIKALRADETKRAEYVGKYFNMGVPMDTLIDAYGLPFPKIKGVTNISYLPMSVLPAGEISAIQDGESSLAMSEQMEKEFDEAAKARTTPTRGQLRAKHHRFMLLAGNLSKPFQKSMRTYFDAQRDMVLGALNGYQGQRPGMQDLGISERDMNSALEKVMTPHIKKSVYEGRDSENMMLKEFTGKDAPKVSDKAVGRIEDWIKLKAFAWAEGVNSATLKKLQKVIDAAIAEGEGIDEISKRVAGVFDTERDYRTLRIAQTEVIASLNNGAIEAYIDNEMVERKGWLPAYDEVTRESHAQAGHTYGVRGAIPIGEDFVLTSGGVGPGPGDMGNPGDDINCRCTLFPVTKKR